MQSSTGWLHFYFNLLQKTFFLPVTKRLSPRITYRKSQRMNIDTYKQEAARLRPRLLLIARRYTGSDEEGEDIVQDCLLKIWMMREDLSIPLDALAVTITRNLCIDYFRQQRQTALPENQATDCDGERIERMMSIVRTLPDMQQTVLRLRHIEGMEMAEIAQLTGSTETAVRKALSRARLAVKKQYSRRKNDD